MKSFLTACCALLLLSCTSVSEDPEGNCPRGRVWDAFGENCRPLLPDRSKEGSHWEPGVVAFREATSRWGLDALGVEGVRLSVADVDGDGWPDLSVRRAGSAPDDFSSGGARATWLLRNVQGERFEDITRSSGFVSPRDGTEAVQGRPAEVVVWADVDNDGDMDAFTGASIMDSFGQSSELMLNDGKGSFSLASASFPGRRAGDRVGVGGAVFLDVDRDGWVDLFVGHGVGPGGAPEQDRLYRNFGTGGFRDITDQVGLLTQPWNSFENLDAARSHSNAWGVAACDLDGDGYSEILVSSYGRAPNHLWLGNGLAGFENQSISSGYAFDHRRDWSDNESARCHCKLNPQDEECEGVPPPSAISCEKQEDAFRWNHVNDRRPYRLGGNSGTTVCADVDNDGHLDLFTTEIVHWDVGSSSDPSEFLRNTGEVPLRFDRPGGDATGLKRPRDRQDWNDGDMTAAVFDFDNDGRPDIYLGSSDYPGTRGWLYWQAQDGTFLAVPSALGIDQLSSHGIAIADFDGDGDLDVVVGHSRTRCADQCYEKGTTRFFENVIGDQGNWLQLGLEGGEGTNRAAIGARVRVETEAGIQTQEVGGGHGHYGIQHDQVLHFGIGTAKEARVTVRWPDGELSVQRFTVQAGYRYELSQGELPLPMRGVNR